MKRPRTVFNTIPKLKVFKHGPYEGHGGGAAMIPIKQIFEVGIFSLWWVARIITDGTEYNKAELEDLQIYVDLMLINYKQDSDLPAASIKYVPGKRIPKDRMLLAYSKQDGGCIGRPATALSKIHRFGIKKFYRRAPGSSVCSIGFSPFEQKYYGWSHRAICGFGVGYVVPENGLVRSNGWIEGCSKYEESEKLKPETGFEAKTLEDCRFLADRFAESVA